MKCPKCRYVSHDYLDSCRKCSTDLVEFKRKFNLMVLRPGDLDLGILVDVGREDVVSRDRLRLAAATSDTPPSKSYIGLDELTADTEIDIQFDPDTPNTSTEPGELTKTFYVPEVLAKQISEVHLPDRTRLDELPATPEGDLPFDLSILEPLAAPTTDDSAAASDGPVPLASPESADMSVGHLDDRMDELPATPEGDLPFDPDTPNTSPAPGGLTRMFYVGLNELPAAPEIDLPFDPDTLEPLTAPTTDDSAAASDRPVPLADLGLAAQYVQYPPVDTTDMSVGHLDNYLDEFEDIQLDTSEIDHNIDLLSLPAAAERAPACDDDVARREIEEITPDISSTSVVDETSEPMRSMAQAEPLETAAPLDSLADDALGVKLEETGDVPSPSAEGHTGTERAE